MRSLTNAYDVIVLGGGIIGATSAYELAKSGRNVLLLEKNHVGFGASGSSAAMLELQIDAYRGEPFYSLARASHDLFPSLYTEIKSLTGIDFEFDRCGILQLAFNEDEATWLKKEMIWQAKIGLTCQWLTPEGLEDAMPELGVTEFGGAFFAEDGQVNGEKFLSAMIKAFQLQGGELKEGVQDISLEANADGHVTVQSSLGKLKANHVVVACGAWTDQILESLGVRLDIKPVRGQLIVYDTPTPYFKFPIYTKHGSYVTPKASGYTLAGTTVEDVGFDNSTSDEGRELILQRVRRVFPALTRAKIRGLSAGLRPRSPDELPFLGPLPQHPKVLVAAGHYRNGILLAPITAKIIEALVAGREPPVSISLLGPGRLIAK